MNFVVNAFLLNGSNVVFIDKDHLKNAESQTFWDVEIYLSEEEIRNLYHRLEVLKNERD